MLEARGLCKSYGSRAVVVPQELSIYENLGTEANLVLFGALYGLSGALLATFRRKNRRGSGGPEWVWASRWRC